MRNNPPPRLGQDEVLPYVLQDMQERARAGEQKYGTRLMTHNGRDAMWDAYEEALDLVMYLRQAILEREGTTVKCPKCGTVMVFMHSLPKGKGVWVCPECGEEKIAHV